MDVGRYLARIGFSGPVDVSLKCLSELMSSHQLAVPFENLDVFLGRKKVLDVELLFTRIVEEERGGWCCELNGLFAWLLQELGSEFSETLGIGLEIQDLGCQDQILVSVLTEF